MTVVDDYAHHPTEIAALLDAARRRYPQSSTSKASSSRTCSARVFPALEFAQVLAKADDVIVTGIFPRARRGRISLNDPATIVTRRLLEHELAKDLGTVASKTAHTAAQMMVMRAHHGDAVFTVGAGDITQMTRSSRIRGRPTEQD